MNRWLVVDVAVGSAVRSGVTQPVIVIVCDCRVVVDVDEVVGVDGVCGVCAESTAVAATMPQYTPSRFFICNVTKWPQSLVGKSSIIILNILIVEKEAFQCILSV